MIGARHFDDKAFSLASPLVLTLKNTRAGSGLVGVNLLPGLTVGRGTPTYFPSTCDQRWLAWEGFPSSSADGARFWEHSRVLGDGRRRLCFPKSSPLWGTRGMRTPPPIEPPFSVQAPDGAMAQALETLIYYFRNEFGDFGGWCSRGTRFCFVYQAADKRCKDCI